jgi:iron complex transport system ATP-binding protein
MEILLRVEKIRVTRGGTPVIKKISWEMRRGERWVIMGANGSGKTSLLSVLTGFLVPTEGEISLLGKTYGEDDWSSLKKAVALVSSSVRQLVQEEETALEVIGSGFHGQINFWGRLSQTEIQRATQIGRSLGCGKILSRPWAVLSQGERQRVLIGRALAAEPELLILDEPCAGLDPAAREQFLNFLDTLARKRHGPAIILVTHHIEEIMPAFTHVLGLRDGRVVAQGKTSEVITSAVLSKLFQAPVTVHQEGSRYALHVAPRRGRAM